MNTTCVIFKKAEKITVLSTEAPVEPVEADLFHGVLTSAVVQSPLKFWIRGTLLDAHPLQLVLMVQQLIQQLVHLRAKFVSLQTRGVKKTQKSQAFSNHLHDSDFVGLHPYGPKKGLSHMVIFVRALVNLGGIGQVCQRGAFLS